MQSKKNINKDKDKIIPSSSNNKEEDKNNIQNELAQCEIWFKKIEKFLEDDETKDNNTEIAIEKIID
jgi:hypothetical protein